MSDLPAPPPPPPASAPLPPVAATAAPSKGLAIAALVTAIFCAPVGLILGIVVLATKRPGKGLAIAGIVISILSMVTGGILFATGFNAVINGTADRNDKGTVVDGGTVPTSSLKTGDCVLHGLKSGGALPDTVQVVPCAKPHAMEAYAQFSLPAGKFPGDDQVQRRSAGACTTEFVKFAGIGFQQSKLDMFYFQPSSQSWAQGDRSVVCLIHEHNYTPVTGTLRGAKR
ncbi:MAG: septum formation family protein [Aeromicrobium sp.]